MANDEIIELLRKLQTENPEKYKEYLKYYKEKFPEFFKQTLVPLFSIDVAEEPKKVDLTNPAEALADGDLKPLGSANIGEESYEENPKKEVKVETKPPVIKKKNTLKTVLVIVGIVAVLTVAGVLIYLNFFVQ